ncbi:RNA pseudouridine synthase [Aphanothece hegewaldii CCALA 016]|uniref:Pseudouridine synthase n=1 Tax=Aphanothece hegewaldii CCALA 016 TaxID=2107694 RepID=A0A2T1M216_9CHRO|nr:RluA family pseudouridine synthase [Aphanothece hegewaldii]PSF38759.1 RNA pseudouridine synthase [Aphanothece hegewaldii CCALA 016]
MNQGWVYRNQVRQTEAGLTLLEYYSQYRHSSYQEWRERILLGQILINNQPATPDTILKKGQSLTYHRQPWHEPDVPLSFAILYEDSDLLIVDKPSGLPVLPGGGFLEHTLLKQLQQQYPNDTPYPIHRLGRGTSGLMLLAKTSQARASLSQQMRDRQISKTYRALVGKSDLPENLIITQPIGKIPHPVLGYIYGATPDGLSAYSECQVLKRTSQTTLLAVKILTGRPHQIRIHLATVGYPLLGDPLYDIGGIPKMTKSENLPVPGDIGYSLHAHHLFFLHPSTGKVMSIYSSPPNELQEETQIS